VNKFLVGFKEQEVESRLHGFKGNKNWWVWFLTFVCSGFGPGFDME
jgi:hypothetical protein